MTELLFSERNLAALRQLFERPKATDSEGPLIALQAIDTGLVALEQAALTQTLADQGISRFDPRVACLLIPYAGHQ